MSTLPAPLQPKQDALAATRRAHRLLSNDLRVFPAEKQNASPGGCARTPLHIVAECALINGYVADGLTTGEIKRQSPEERDPYLKSFDSEEKALAYLDRETERLLAAIEGMDEATMGEVSDKPLGRPLSRFGLALMPSSHMMYHDGQLCYLQTLYGDGESHVS